MQKDFTIVILSDANEPENFQEILSGLGPWMESFYRFKVTKFQKTVQKPDEDFHSHLLKITQPASAQAAAATI